MIPWFEWPYIFDVRARPNVIQSTSGSKDLQMVRKQPGGTVSTLGAAVCVYMLYSAITNCKTRIKMLTPGYPAGVVGRLAWQVDNSSRLCVLKRINFCKTCT